jgi:hypothetical protein
VPGERVIFEKIFPRLKRIIINRKKLLTMLPNLTGHDLAPNKGGKIVSQENKTLTTAFGILVADDQNSMTAGERGAVLLQGA